MDNLTVDGNGIHITISIGRVTLDLYNAQGNDKTEKERDTQNANDPSNENKTGKSNARTIVEYPLQQRVKHVGSDRRMKYIISR